MACTGNPVVRESLLAPQHRLETVGQTARGNRDMHGIIPPDGPAKLLGRQRRPYLYSRKGVSRQLCAPIRPGILGLDQ